MGLGVLTGATDGSGHTEVVISGDSGTGIMKKRRQKGTPASEVEPSTGLGVDKDSEVDHAVTDLLQKMSRQKRRPKRLTNTDSTQTMAPRSGQVTTHSPMFI